MSPIEYNSPEMITNDDLAIVCKTEKLQKSDQGFSKLLGNNILEYYTWILYLDTILG